MNKKNNLLEKLLVVGLIGLFGYPMATLNGILLPNEK